MFTHLTLYNSSNNNNNNNNTKSTSGRSRGRAKYARVPTPPLPSLQLYALTICNVKQYSELSPWDSCMLAYAKCPPYSYINVQIIQIIQ